LCSGEDHDSSCVRCDGTSWRWIDSQKQLGYLSNAERICMLAVKITEQWAQGQRWRNECVLRTSTSALNNFSILSKIRIVGLCHRALSNQYRNRLFSVEMGCSVYREKST
jgi:hypothetical protein